MNKTTIIQSEQRSLIAYSIVLGAILFASLGVVSYASASITTQLDLGSQNSDVTELQTYLAGNPTFYPSGLVTGYFGSLTQAGVEKFQVGQGIVSSGSPATTGYGRVGPSTMASLNAIMGGGMASGDVSAPVIYPASVSVGKNEATIAWTTNESATSRVMYGTSWPFLFATAPSVRTATVGATAQVVISNLQSNTVYYFVRESIDSAGNVAWNYHESFTTSK
jgi:peptidoglycan hydrolase-like protein with peptidoglycan-binding domain